MCKAGKLEKKITEIIIPMGNEIINYFNFLLLYVFVFSDFFTMSLQYLDNHKTIIKKEISRSTVDDKTGKG